MLAARLRNFRKKGHKKNILDEQDWAIVNNSMDKRTLDPHPDTSSGYSSLRASQSAYSSRAHSTIFHHERSEGRKDDGSSRVLPEVRPIELSLISSEDVGGNTEGFGLPQPAIEIQINDCVGESVQADFPTHNEDLALSVTRTPLSGTSLAVNNRHTHSSRVTKYFYDNYNYDLRKIESMTRHQNEIQNSLNWSNADGENLVSRNKNTNLYVPTSKLVFKVHVLNFLKRKQRYGRLAITNLQIHDIERLVMLLDDCDKLFLDSLNKNQPKHRFKPKPSSTSLLNVPSRNAADEESFSEYHSRNLDLCQSVESFLDKRRSSKLSYDLVIEHERGLTLFGYPFFSKSALMRPLDPAPFSNQYNKPVNFTENGHSTSNGAFSYNMNLYPIDGTKWLWKWDKWYVLMLDADIDDQGWVYSGLTFHSRHWSGKYRFGNSVRKRVWIRIKELKKIDSGGKDL